MSVNEFLREAMRARGWTVPRLAEACGVAPGLAQKWVSDNPHYRVTPGPASCEKIARALNADLDYVLALAGHRSTPTPPSTDSPALAALIVILRQRWDELEQEEQRRVDAVVRVLIERTELDRPKSEIVRPARRQASQSVRAMIAEFGLQPTY